MDLEIHFASQWKPTNNVQWSMNLLMLAEQGTVQEIFAAVSLTDDTVTRGRHPLVASHNVAAKKRPYGAVRCSKLVASIFLPTAQ